MLLRVAAAAALAVGTSAYAAEGGGAKLDKSLEKAAQKLHAANQGEVQAGQAALRSAQSQEVKQFAQQMIDDHQKNDSQLQQLASTMSVSLEGDEFKKKQKKAQEDLEKVQAKGGAEFDKAYMKMMVKEHEQDVKDVEKAAKDARKQNQTQLASFLEETHSHLRMHLDSARTVEKSLGGAGMAGSSSGSRDTAASSTSGSGSAGSSPSVGDSPTGTATDTTGRAATTGGTSGAETGTDTGASGDTKDTGTSSTTGGSGTSSGTTR
jgi:putative membrane protein